MEKPTLIQWITAKVMAYTQALFIPILLVLTLYTVNTWKEVQYDKMQNQRDIAIYNKTGG